MNGMESINNLASLWSGTMLQTLIETSILFIIVYAIWCLIRKRASVQFGYALFLLVLIKPLVPVQYSIPLPVWEEPVEQSTEIANNQLAANSAITGTPSLPAEEFNESVEGKPESVANQSKSNSPIPSEQSVGSTVPQTNKSHSTSTNTSFSLPLETLLFLLWAGIVLVLSCAFAWKHASLRKQFQQAVAIDPNSHGLDWESMKQKAGVIGGITLFTHEEVKAPFVWGMIKPRIFLPKHFFTSISPEQQIWILLHELAHIRRGDLYIAWFQRAMQVVFFFHPAIWAANYFVDRLREYACDDFAYAVSQSSRKACGEGLLKIIEQSQQVPAGALSGMGLLGRDSFVKTRLVRLLDHTRKVQARLPLRAKVCVCIIALAALPSMHFYAAPINAAPINAAENDAQGSSLTFDGSITLKGTVIDQKTHEPITGAVVKLLPTDQDIESNTPLQDVETAAQAISNDNGEFQFEGVPENEYKVLCYADGYLPYNPSSRHSLDPLTRVPVDAAHDGQTISVLMQPGHAIDVQVFDPTGQPLEGAKVLPVISGMYIPLQLKTTDYEGRCTFNTLVQNTGKLLVKHDDWGSQVSETFVPGSQDNPTLIQMQVQPTGSISGTVKLKDGTPGKNITIYANYSSAVRGVSSVQNKESLEAQSDENGRYVFTTLGPGSYRLWANNNDKSEEWYDSNHESVELTAGEMKTGVDFEVQKFPTNFEYTLKVIGPNGEPIPHANFNIHYRDRHIEGFRSYPAGMTNDHGTTNAKGEYHFTNVLPSKSIDIGVGAKGYISYSEDKLELNEVVTVQLKPAGAVNGKVMDASGNPIAGAVVYVDGGDNFRYGNHASETTTGDSPHNITDNNGNFEIDSLYPANMKVYTNALGYMKSQGKTVRIQSGKTIDNITLTLQKGTSVKGIVQDTQGNPISGVQIGLRSNANIPNPNMIGLFETTTLEDSVLTNKQGSFEIDEVNHGETLCIWHEDFAPTEVKVTPEMLEGTKATITMHEGGTLVGNVYEDGGGPLVGAKLQIFTWPVKLYTYEVIIGEDGTYKLEHLPAKEFFVRKSYSGPKDPNNHENLIVQIEKGKTTRADFGKGPGTTVQGIVFENDEPLTEVRVALVKDLQSTHRDSFITSDANDKGEYIFQAVPAGEWYLFFQKSNNFGMFHISGQYAEHIKKITILSEQQEYTFDLHMKPFDINIKTVDAENSEPITKAIVQVDFESAGIPYDYNLRGQTDENGERTLKAKMAYTYPVIIRKQGFIPQNVSINIPPLQDGENHKVIDQEVKLKPYTSDVELNVHLTYNGKPFESDKLNVLIKKNGLQYPTVTKPVSDGKPGQYRVEGCPSGEVALMVRYHDDEKNLMVPEQTLTLQSGETRTFMTKLVKVHPYQFILNTKDKRLDEGFARVEIPDFPEFDSMFSKVPIETHGLVIPMPLGKHDVKIFIEGYQPLTVIPGQLADPDERTHNTTPIHLELKK